MTTHRDTLNTLLSGFIDAAQKPIPRVSAELDVRANYPNITLRSNAYLIISTVQSLLFDARVGAEAIEVALALNAAGDELVQDLSTAACFRDIAVMRLQIIRFYRSLKPENYNADFATHAETGCVSCRLLQRAKNASPMELEELELVSPLRIEIECNLCEDDPLEKP